MFWEGKAGKGRQAKFASVVITAVVLSTRNCHTCST